MTLSSSLPNPVRPIGSTVTLTCVVRITELSLAVDIPVTLNTMWTGPDGFKTINTSQPILGSSTTYTGRAVVSSFGRNESGIYTCTASLSLTNLYLISGGTTSGSILVTTGEKLENYTNFRLLDNCIYFAGVYLALRNQLFIANNTQINIRSIGLSSDNPNGALQCITDRKHCCYDLSHRHGEWYLPNGMVVHHQWDGDVGFYRNRGDNGRVYLNHPTINDTTTMSPTGRFCCEVPDATGVNQTICALIGKLNIEIIISNNLF